MTIASKTLILAVVAVGTMLLLLTVAAPRQSDRPSPDAAETVTSPAASPASTPSVVDSSAQPSDRRFYFDVENHSAEDFYALLQRAHMIYEQTPTAERDALEVVMVLHGPDIAYFDAEHYSEHHNIVDLAAKLDAFGVFDFKVCTVAANTRGLSAEHLPAFIEFVPFGPGEIAGLEAAGFVRL